LYTSYKSFTVIEYPHYENRNNNLIDKKLLKGKKLIGEFSAEENNLAIISLRFGRIPVVNFAKEDILTFKIKEKGQPNWISENRFRSGIMESYSFFPFGFEPIKDSENKTYVFEVTSLKGTPSNAVTTHRTNPIFISKYKYTKNEIVSSINSITKFLFVKIFTFLINFDALLSSSVFLIPFVFTLLSFVSGKRGFLGNVLFSSKQNKRVNTKIIERNLFTVVVLSLIFFDLLFFENLITGLMLGLLGFWVINIYLNHLSSKATFILAFAILVISLVSMYLDWAILIAKSSAFAYFLVLIGFVQSVFESRRNKS
jgi:hypothetical protein